MYLIPVFILTHLSEYFSEVAKEGFPWVCLRCLVGNHPHCSLANLLMP